MPFTSAHTVVDVYPEAVCQNWKRVSSFISSPPSAWPGAMAVVKADAYGHGLLPVSRALLKAGAAAFAVGDVAEGVKLARALDRRDIKIVPLLGPHSIQEADRCLAFGLVPFIHRAGQAAMLAARAREAGIASPVPLVIKMDTGLCRLGFREAALVPLIEELRATPELRPSLLLSHYATADMPEARDTTEDQVQLFLRFLAAFRIHWPDMAASIANSAGFMNAPPALFRELGANVIRPGINLYGGNPFTGTLLEEKGSGYMQAMEVRSPVLEVKEIPAGAKVSYGHTFTAPRPMRIAVLGTGYADGLSRGLSGTGAVVIHGKRAPRLGRICMQMHMADVSHIPECAAGDSAYILGGPGDGIDAHELAGWWGTIPYEVFCILGKKSRVVHKGLPNAGKAF